MTEAGTNPEINEAEQKLRTKAEEFEHTLDRLTQKMQEGTDFLRKFREDTSQFVEQVRQPGAVLQPYLEKGMQLAEDYVQSYLHDKRSTLEHYVTEAAHALEQGTDRLLDRVTHSFRNQVDKIEARPLIPGVALFLGGFVLGGLVMRQYRGRAAGEPSAFPGLRRVGGTSPSSASSEPSGSTG